MSSSHMLKKLDLSQLKQPVKPEETEYKYIDLTNAHNISPYIQEDIFSYEKMASSYYKESEGYFSHYKGGEGYISFCSLQINNSTPQRRPYREYGLKIHISLDDTIENNIENGWNAIAGILKYYNIGRTKVIKIPRIIEIDEKQPDYSRGKQITIYASVNANSINWPNILCAITQALLQKGIKPGYRPDQNSSKALEGNCYISYRYDWDLESQKGRKARSRDGAFPTSVKDTLEIECQSVKDILTPDQKPKSSSSHTSFLSTTTSTTSNKEEEIYKIRKGPG